MADDEEIVYDVCTELHRNHERRATRPTQRAVAKFGEQGVIDIVGIQGYYTLLAMVLNTARTPLPAGRTPALAAFRGDRGSPLRSITEQRDDGAPRVSVCIRPS